jgi:hypothetical protein
MLGKRSSGLNPIVLAFLGVAMLHYAPNCVAAEQACPFRLTASFQEPVHSVDTFSLEANLDSHNNAAPVHVSFGIHHLYDITDGDTKVNEGDLQPGHPRQFNINLLGGTPGIDTLEVTVADHPECDSKFEFDTGFQVNVKVRCLSNTLDFQDPPSVSVDSGVLSFPLQLVNSQTGIASDFKEPMLISVGVIGDSTDDVWVGLNGSRIRDSQARVPLSGTFQLLRVQDDHWGKSRTVTVEIYEASKAHSNWDSEGQTGPHVLGSYLLYYRTTFPDYMLCLMTLLGALGWVAVESLPALNKTNQPSLTWWKLVTLDRCSKIGTAIAIALMAFFMAYVPLVKAIKLDRSSLISYLIYGFCVGVVGIEGLLKKIKELSA